VFPSTIDTSQQTRTRLPFDAVLHTPSALERLHTTLTTGNSLRRTTSRSTCAQLLFNLLAAQQRTHSSTPHSRVPPRPPRPRPHRQHRWRGSSQRGGHQRRKSLQGALAPAMIHKQESRRRDRSAMSTEVRAAKGRLPFHTYAVHKLLGQRTWTVASAPPKTCWPRVGHG
jgi:hypothetical protein